MSEDAVAMSWAAKALLTGASLLIVQTLGAT
jgi:hypothetical protein